MNSKLTNWIPWLMGLSAILGLVAGLKVNKTPFFARADANTELFTSNKKFIEASSIIEENLLDFPNGTSIQDVAISAILNELDAYSKFYPFKGKELLSNNFSSTTRDFGLTIRAFKDELYIQSIYNTDLLAEAKLLPGDEIIKINNQPISNLNDISTQLLGDSILITTRNNLGQSERVLIKSEHQQKSVGKMILFENNIRYFRIKRFRDNSYSEMMSLLDEVILSNEEINLIIDLRGNPGGYTEEAVKIVNQFIPERDFNFLNIIYGNGKDRNYKSTGKVFGNFKKVVILIDKKSASSAEIVAGALKGMDKVVVIGQESKGKRTIQRDYVLSDDSHLYLTVAKYDFPEQNLSDSIFGSKGGIYPEIRVEVGPVSKGLSFHSYCQWVNSCKSDKGNALDYSCLSDKIVGVNNYSIEWLDWIEPSLSIEYYKKILITKDPYVIKAISEIQ